MENTNVNESNEDHEFVVGQYHHVRVYEPDFGWESGWAFECDPSDPHLMVLDNEFDQIPANSLILVDDDMNIIKSTNLFFSEICDADTWPVPKTDEDYKRIDKEYYDRNKY